jgi:hypothetical protein
VLFVRWAALAVMAFKRQWHRTIAVLGVSRVKVLARNAAVPLRQPRRIVGPRSRSER